MIAIPGGEVYYNSSGNPGMAKGGSGDVLTGILVSLLGQGYEPRHAALLGVFLHGLSGDLAASALAEETMVASDLISFLPQAFKKVY
jgi:NAD(P)H-hydrate repair Nnr-like enzyme with NAD(P)H-hydrate dehydratase domain